MVPGQLQGNSDPLAQRGPGESLLSAPTTPAPTRTSTRSSRPGPALGSDTRGSEQPAARACPRLSLPCSGSSRRPAGPVGNGAPGGPDQEGGPRGGRGGGEDPQAQPLPARPPRLLPAPAAAHAPPQAGGPAPGSPSEPGAGARPAA